MVRAAADGSEAAWAALVDRFAGVIWAVARAQGLDPSDAADVSQTTWLRFAEHIDQLREAERAAGWLVTTARREAVRISRLGARHLLVDPWTELARRDEEVEIDEALLDQERSVVLQQSFAALPDRCRRLLQALAAEDASYADLGQRLDMPVGSIGPTRARCLEKLRALMSRLEEGQLNPLTFGKDQVHER